LHRDIKPGNVFFDQGNNIKLGDFGLSRILSETSNYAKTNVGTPYYMSPEQVNESEYNEKSDIWSAGCLLYEIVAL
jgi:serine/threonine protein kinase